MILKLHLLILLSFIIGFLSLSSALACHTVKNQSSQKIKIIWCSKDSMDKKKPQKCTQPRFAVPNEKKIHCYGSWNQVNRIVKIWYKSKLGNYYSVCTKQAGDDLSPLTVSTGRNNLPVCKLPK